MADYSHPTTIRGLVSELEKNGADAALMADAFTSFANELPAPLRLTGRTKTDPRFRSGRSHRAAVVGASVAVLRAAELARELSDALRAAPVILAALKPLTLAVPAAAFTTEPLYVPDDNDPRVIRHAATGAVHDDPSAPIVGWWPFLPAAARSAGLTIDDCRPDALQLDYATTHDNGTVARSVSNPVRALILSANTIQSVRCRERGLDKLAHFLRGGVHRGSAASTRRQVRAAANKLLETVDFLWPLGDQLAANYGRYVSDLSAALQALSISEGLKMPNLTNLASAAITDLATRIRDAITEGHGGRLTVGDQEVSFSWNPGPPVTLLSYLTPGFVTGRTTTVIRAKDSATPVGPVAEGGTKSNVVDFESEEVSLKKFPGQAQITTESAMFVNNIELAVSATIVGQVIRAIEQDAAGVIADAAGIEITGATDITSGVLSAIAAIRENGGVPNVVGLNSADWVDLMSASGGAGGYTNMNSPESGPGPLWMGLAPVIIPGQAAGTAIVVDGRTVTVSEPKGSPLAILDPFTLAGNNKIVITIEAWAVSAVASPGGVATVAVATTP